MSSTNKTTNYSLSQYIGTDKPTYLGDYNGDMLKIDKQMKANSDAATNAASAASAANAVADKAAQDVHNLNASVTDNSMEIASLKTKNGQQDVSIQNATNIANTANATAKQNELNIGNINTHNVWTQGTNIQNTGLPNYTSGSWDCSYNSFSGLLNLNGQITLSEGTTVAANTTIATIPDKIMKMIGSTGNRKIWTSLFITYLDGTVQVYNLVLDRTGKIYCEVTLNPVQYMNVQLTLNTSTWKN